MIKLVKFFPHQFNPSRISHGFFDVLWFGSTHDDLSSNDVQKGVVDIMYAYLTNQHDETMSPLGLVPVYKIYFTIISNLLFDNDKINSDEINSHVEFNFDESTFNHDTEKSDYLDEFYGPFIPIHILEEERTRREHAININRMEMLITINPHEEVDAVDLRVDNFIQNFEHEYSESEDSDFDNPLLSLPPLEPLDKEFDFEKEILVERNVIVKFECIDVRVKFDIFNDENDVLSYFMFVIFAKEFSLLSAECEDTIFDPSISD
uniref:Uncharacterized protein n=1 Tax=Tanacetum cinerariifolium TaxID=118510 RepID=A0A699K9W2_TANCI|nr:hypothetical protein [Tanacetum cinerariifolium]